MTSRQRKYVNSQTLEACLNMKADSMMKNNVAALNYAPWVAHLGGHNAVVRETLRDVGLSSWRGFFMPDVDRPTVHPDLLPHTLTERKYIVKIQVERFIQSSAQPSPINMLLTNISLLYCVQRTLHSQVNIFIYIFTLSDASSIILLGLCSNIYQRLVDV